jgi:hypothetical protein
MSNIIFSKKKILAKITSIIRNFWLKRVNSDQANRPLYLAAWKNICAPKKEGGLGIQNLTAVNHGLLLASALGIAYHPNSQLHQIIKSKYFFDTSIWKPKPNKPKFAL